MLRVLRWYHHPAAGGQGSANFLSASLSCRRLTACRGASQSSLISLLRELGGGGPTRLLLGPQQRTFAVSSCRPFARTLLEGRPCVKQQQQRLLLESSSRSHHPIAIMRGGSRNSGRRLYSESKVEGSGRHKFTTDLKCEPLLEFFSLPMIFDFLPFLLTLTIPRLQDSAVQLLCHGNVAFPLLPPLFLGMLVWSMPRSPQVNTKSTTWLLLGTTTLVSVLLWAANTLQFQGTSHSALFWSLLTCKSLT